MPTRRRGGGKVFGGKGEGVEKSSLKGLVEEGAGVGGVITCAAGSEFGGVHGGINGIEPFASRRGANAPHRGEDDSEEGLFSSIAAR